MVINLGKGRFIIDTTEDRYALAAMEAYADACDHTAPALAQSVRGWTGVSLGSLACIETALRIVSSAQAVGQMHEGYSKQAWEQVQATLKTLTSRTVDESEMQG